MKYGECSFNAFKPIERIVGCETKEKLNKIDEKCHLTAEKRLTMRHYKKAEK